jgi:hypothetical protein
LAQTSYSKTYSNLVAVCWPKFHIRRLIRISMVVFEISNSNYLSGPSYEARRCGSSSPKWRMLCRRPPYNSAGTPVGYYLEGAGGDALMIYSSRVHSPKKTSLDRIPFQKMHKIIFVSKTLCKLYFSNGPTWFLVRASTLPHIPLDALHASHVVLINNLETFKYA